MLQQQVQLKRLISSIANGQQDIQDLNEHHLVKKIKTEHHESSDSADEGIHCNASPIDSMDNVDELKSELIEVRKALDRERKLRMSLEDQVKSLETQLYPERVKEIAQSVQVKLHKQNSESMDVSESEDQAAVAALVDDDGVIAETIEIETGSCPASPQPTTIVIQGAGGQTFTANPIQFRTVTSGGQVIHVSEAAPAKTTGGRKHSTSKGSSSSTSSSQQPAAIALPIEVPFISSGAVVSSSSGSIVTSSGGNTVTVQIIGAPGVSVGGGQCVTASVVDPNAGANATSRHNLETIVEAIRHLEGDHMFKDDTVGEGVPIEEVITTEEIAIEAGGGDAVTTIEIPVTSTSSTTRTVKTSAIRQKVIRSSTTTTTSSQSRPGVIVAKVTNQ